LIFKSDVGKRNRRKGKRVLSSEGCSSLKGATKSSSATTPIPDGRRLAHLIKVTRERESLYIPPLEEKKSNEKHRLYITS
jgi:hypothetical protein